jgi:hypothetical protein
MSGYQSYGVDHDDDGLLDALGHVIRCVDPPPERMIGAARAALAWGAVEAELAALPELPREAVSARRILGDGFSGPLR